MTLNVGQTDPPFSCFNSFMTFEIILYGTIVLIPIISYSVNTHYILIYMVILISILENELCCTALKEFI